MSDKMSKPFSITTVCRKDLLGHFTEEQVDALDDADMEELAQRMEDDYVSHRFWSSLRILAANILDRYCDPEEGCPCGNRDKETLIWDGESEYVRCMECGDLYRGEL